MTRLPTALLIVLAAIGTSIYGVPGSGLAQSGSELGAGDLNCGHLLTTEHADAVFEASNDPANPDPYGLDGQPGAAFAGVENVPCEDASDFGTEEDAPANCSHFLPASQGGQDHAQALYDASNGGQGYDLAAVDGIACAAGFAPPSDLPSDIPVDTPPPATVPDATGCDVQVQAGRAYVNTDCADGTVEAGFLPFEGFDDFAARAQNGFGLFAETSSQPTTVEVQQSLPAAGSSGGISQESTTTEPRVIEGKQKASTAKAKQKRMKAKKSKRIKERKLQRARLRQQAQDRD